MWHARSETARSGGCIGRTPRKDPLQHVCKVGAVTTGRLGCRSGVLRAPIGVGGIRLRVSWAAIFRWAR
eukprot:6839914-Pyramimonas_sp.AAC.1